MKFKFLSPISLDGNPGFSRIGPFRRDATALAGIPPASER